MLYNWTLGKPESLFYWLQLAAILYLDLETLLYLTHFGSFETFKLENFSNTSGNTSQSKKNVNPLDQSDVQGW